MINCPKCQSENHLGAIFCRSCGDKLDMDELRPADIKKTAKNAVNAGAILRNIIGLVALLAVAALAAGIYIAPPLPTVTALSPENAKAMRRRVSFIVGGQTASETFTTSELNGLAEFVLDMSAESVLQRRQEAIESGAGGALVPQGFYVELLPPDHIKFTVKHLLKNKLTFYASIEGKLEVSDAGLTFSRDKMTHGRVPLLIKQLEEKIISQRFTKLTTTESARYESLLKGMKNVTGFKIEGDKITVTLGPARKLPK
ncbi:MAG: zinc ribbon domain-containing protein [Lentisphaeria bacterium]|nr:zinc ribbon domain-containing protein [Lentisphaeria bacterium]